MLIFGFLCKDFFMVLIVGASVFKGVSGGGNSELINLVSPAFFFADLPIIALLYAFNLRRPDGGTIPRFLWRYGRYFVTLSIFLYTLILFLLRGFDITNLSILDGVVCFINMGILYYIYSFEIIKDIFAEFPILTRQDNATK
jgi:hypothetical protein